MNENDPIYTTPVFSLVEVISMFNALKNVLEKLEEIDALSIPYIAFGIGKIFEEYPLLNDWMNKQGAFEDRKHNEY